MARSFSCVRNVVVQAGWIRLDHCAGAIEENKAKLCTGHMSGEGLRGIESVAYFLCDGVWIYWVDRSDFFPSAQRMDQIAAM